MPRTAKDLRPAIDAELDKIRDQYDDVESSEIDAKDAEQYADASWTDAEWVPMYQPVDKNGQFWTRGNPRRAEGVYWFKSLILGQYVDKKAATRGSFGKVWYRTSELPPNAVVYDAVDFAKVRCPRCGKKTPSWYAVRAHMKAKHTEEYGPYEEFVEAQVKTEARADESDFQL